MPQYKNLNIYVLNRGAMTGQILDKIQTLTYVMPYSILD